MNPRKEMEWMPDWAHALQPIQLEEVDRLCKLCDCKIIVDVGCFIGGFTKIMAKNAKEKNGMVYSVDLFKLAFEPVVNWGCHQGSDTKELLRRHMEERGLNEFVTIIEDYAKNIVNNFDDNSVDFVFLDAAHNYNSVKQDIELWYPKVKIGGIIAGHDYDSPIYDEKWIHEDGHGSNHHGVVKAVNEFFESRNLTFKKGGSQNNINNIWSSMKDK